MQSKKALPLLIALALAGCAGDKSTQLPASTKILDAVPRVDNSVVAPCWQQKQIAAQNSYLDTIKAGSDKVYRAPCEDPKFAPKVAAAGAAK